MKVKTTRVINCKSEKIWPLLTQSEMTVPGCFCFGVPKPVACELPSQVGGVGSERRCISDRGVVIQRILEWEPPSSLRFQMESTDHCWAPCVESIDEAFELIETDDVTTITRTTTFSARGWFRSWKELMFWIGLKRVHLFVFKNWREQSEQTAALGRASSQP